MDLPFELFVAVRYLLAGRKQAFISLISLISTIGVAVGVMALIVALALMTGLQQEMRDRGSWVRARTCTSFKAGGLGDYQEEARKLEAIDGVEGAAPMMLGKALIDSSQRAGVHVAEGHRSQARSRVTDLQRVDAVGPDRGSRSRPRARATGSSSARISPISSAHSSAIRSSC